MVLFNPSTSTIFNSVFALFTFHYGSIQSISLLALCLMCLALHSSMVLLNRYTSSRLQLSGLPLHSSMVLLNRHWPIETDLRILSLHSSMVLLNLPTESVQFHLPISLHSSMVLLNPGLILSMAQSCSFTFQYGSIKSSVFSRLQIFR